MAGLRMIEPAAEHPARAEVLFSDARGFEPATAHHTFRLAASDYLDPLFLPQLVAQIKAQAPLLPDRDPPALAPIPTTATTWPRATWTW